MAVSARLDKLVHRTFLKDLQVVAAAMDGLGQGGVFPDVSEDCYCHQHRNVSSSKLGKELAVQKKVIIWQLKSCQNID